MEARKCQLAFCPSKFHWISTHLDGQGKGRLVTSNMPLIEYQLQASVNPTKKKTRLFYNSASSPTILPYTEKSTRKRFGKFHFLLFHFLADDLTFHR